MATLVICEKPSVAAGIASVLGAGKRGNGHYSGNDYLVSWCMGHLLAPAPPDAYDEKLKRWRYRDLPIAPAEWKYIPAGDKGGQLEILAGLMNRPDVDLIVNACDAGREGELIFRHVLDHAKSGKPHKRLWISSLENSAIRDGFANLRDGADFDRLADAAACREKADWLVGISATRLFSILYGQTLNTGRVQSPTLALLASREAEIDNFVKKPFYTVELDAGSFTASSPKFDDKGRAEEVMSGLTAATVTEVTATEKSAAPPRLHDLTALQREANRAHGFTAQQPLDYLQSLYEKKLATYPRTDSRFLTEDMRETAAALVSALDGNAPCDVSQVINGKKVTDHHAIIPTMEAAKADPSALPSGEREILGMIKNRLICAVGEKHRYLETAVTLEAGGTLFTSKGKTVLHEGWKQFAKSAAVDDEDAETQSMPEVSEGRTLPVTASVKEGFTSPPKRHTEDTLLSAMSNAGSEDMPKDAEHGGLGTPATRAAIIEKLISSGLAERSKKSLLPTLKGKTLVSVLPPSLTSAKLTAEWERKLKMIEQGDLAADAFMDGITEFITAIVRENNAPKPEYASLFPDAGKGKSEALGACPRCGLPVREGGKGYFCDNSACGFRLWKASRFWTAKNRPLTAEIVAALLRDGRVRLEDLRSEKTGKTYNATVILDDDGGEFVDFRMEFERKPRRGPRP